MDSRKNMKNRHTRRNTNSTQFQNENLKMEAVFIVSCLAAGVMLLLASRHIEGFAPWYTDRVYPLWLNTTGRIFSLFPFSAIEVLILGVTGYALFRLAGQPLLAAIRRGGRGRGRWTEPGGKKRRGIFKAGLNLLRAAAVLFLLFILNCGINYNRNTLSEETGIAAAAYTAEELELLCRELAEDVNHWSGKVARDSLGVCEVTCDIETAAVEAMHTAGEKYAALAGYCPRPKGLLLSEVLSYQQVSGIFSPFTIEANYNADMVPYNIPFTICHELSHAKGFMREDEANFIAYLACTSADHPEFQYSGALLAWIYSSNQLQKADPAAYDEVYGLLEEGAIADLEANSLFWNRYEGTVAEVSEKMNDGYLKANSQADGIASYDRMVELLVSYYFEQPSASSGL